MWTFMLIYILGLNICQASAKENSTQMHYVKLKIDVNAISRVTEILSTPFVSNASLQVNRLQRTTSCKRVLQSVECNCESGHRWRDTVCQSEQACCGNETCIFPKNSLDMCISDTTVTIAGSLLVGGQKYQGCLAEKTSPKFTECDKDLTKKMKEVYSTLNGFDSLTIKKYRVGSIIADFKMTITSSVDTKYLERQTLKMTSTLNGSLHLETNGVVSLSMPQNPVKYSSLASLTCTTQSDLKAQTEWHLKKHPRVFDITNGTDSSITSTTTRTTLALKNINKLWEGEYSCTYLTKHNLVTIAHKATAVMDVCLKQNIDMTITPRFPRCEEKSKLVQVKVTCAIEKTYEKYTVTWDKENITAQLSELDVSTSGSTETYAAETYVSCDPKEQPTVTCTFRNRCNQTMSRTIKIIIIYVNNVFCEAQDEWPDTKADFTATLKCKGGAGERHRKCTKDGNQGRWEEEESMCVNQDLHKLLQSAVTVDIGLGALDKNADDVFSRLQDATNKTKNINTVANINASIDVLDSLSQKLHDITNETTMNNFLQSSSSLLEKSLEDTWAKTKGPKEENKTLAGRYLESVEQLIEVMNATKANRKANLEVAICSDPKGSKYENKVFNVTVFVDSPSPTVVKTAGFKNLEQYFPSNNSGEPNSIVVSTTTQSKQRSNVKIKINFPLLKPRPRNFQLECVWWDSRTQRWSSEGCEWEGPSNEGVCVCTHLSSFAILMSRYPLDIAWLTEITYAGLSVSVMSLIISLVIELIVWSHVVKTTGLYLRHTAHVNISLSLLVADICFLASSKPSNISPIWCQTFVVLKHYCYLSMFFWVLCLSSTLLHRTVYPLHEVSKKNYLRFSLILGYICPLLIVFITFLTNHGGAEGHYFSRDTCWLIYSGPMKGSLHTFLIPVGIIVFVSVFSMVVVIMKLLSQTNSAGMCNQKEKNAAKTVVRTVVLLTPIFSVTWIFGFGVTLFDLTHGTLAYVANYAFTLLNSFQGLFILLTINLGEKPTREALLNHFRKKTPASTTVSTTGLDSSSSLKK